MTLTDSLSRSAALLESAGQSHVLRWWSELSAGQQAALQSQVDAIDWEQLRGLVRGETCPVDWAELARRAGPAPAISLTRQRDPQFREAAVAAGSQALREGQVAFVLTAGGQGSRLGFEHPKGLFPVGPVSRRTLFQILLDHARARGKRAGATIPVYIMTSPQTDAETRRFLQLHNWFGYPPDGIRVFCQGSMPAVDLETGRVLMQDRGTIATSPDGHGGTLAALVRDGALEDMQRRGIRQVFYGQIDNPLLQVCDPLLLGCHILNHSEMTSQAVRKQDALQKVGNIVSVDGVVQIIEYSDLPESEARRTGSGGELYLWAGSIAVHVFELDFLARAAASADSLPFHRAVKKVPAIDGEGNLLVPEGNNGLKFERFIFDLMPQARNAIVCEVDAEEGFAAVKNADPAPSESPQWVRGKISALHRSWLEKAGCFVREGVQIEISPFFALDADEVARRLPRGTCLNSDTFLFVDPGMDHEPSAGTAS